MTFRYNCLYTVLRIHWEGMEHQAETLPISHVNRNLSSFLLFTNIFDCIGSPHSMTLWSYKYTEQGYLWLFLITVAFTAFGSTGLELGNQLTIMMATASTGHGITICVLNCWLLTNKTSEEVDRSSQMMITWLWDTATATTWDSPNNGKWNCRNCCPKLTVMWNLCFMIASLSNRGSILLLRKDYL